MKYAFLPRLAAVTLGVLAVPCAAQPAAIGNSRLEALKAARAPALVQVSSRQVTDLRCPPHKPGDEECLLEIAGLSADGAQVALYLYNVDATDFVVLSTGDLVERARLLHPDDGRNSLFFLDGARAARLFGTASNAQIWDFRTGKSIEDEKALGRLHAYAAPNLLFAEGGGAGQYCEINVYDGAFRLLTTYTDPRKPLDRCGAFMQNVSADGSVIAAMFVDDQFVEPESAQKLTIAALRWKKPGSLIEVPGTMGAISPSGGKLAVWNEADASAAIFDVASRKKLVTLKRDASKVTGIAWGPDGGIVAVANSDGSIDLYADTGNHLSRFGKLPDDRKCELSYEPAGGLRFTAGGRGILNRCDDVTRLFDAATGALVKEFEASDLSSAELSADGSTVVEVKALLDKDATVTIWKIAG